MNTLKLTRLRVGGKLRWGWIFCREGKAQYGSAGFFTSKAKAIDHFWKCRQTRLFDDNVTVEEEKR